MRKRFSEKRLAASIGRPKRFSKDRFRTVTGVISARNCRGAVESVLLQTLRPNECRPAKSGEEQTKQACRLKKVRVDRRLHFVAQWGCHVYSDIQSPDRHQIVRASCHTKRTIRASKLTRSGRRRRTSHMLARVGWM